MITSTRRRGRRSLAAILAAMLMASVLAVVAGSPAQAANTSGEALVDTNDDGVPDAREFGGRDRYDTALRLAENFATGRGGLGGVPTAFVASGFSLVDAVSVSGLAGFLDAPVLLTPTDSLNGGVADFIEDYGVGTIYVLGGSAAVADSVLEDMEALANEPTVTRIEGADRYATAAAIASKLGGSASWCSGDDVAAILANGGDVSLVEAMLIGPIAHRLQLPVLLTAADELPSATTDFIESEDVEHVVIIGGTDSVSGDVESALTDAGVDNVERIAGDTPAATSVALAELMTGDCEADLAPVSAGTVALVHRDALPDGVTAAPVLASTFANSGDLVPILIVGDTLPASVRDYLAATPAEHANGDKINLSIVAIGGTAVISDSVMEAATTAAVSEDQLTVKISGNPADPDWSLTATDKLGTGAARVADEALGQDPGRTFWLHFSDDIATKDVEAKIRDILEVNGVPARLGVLDVDVLGYQPTRKPIQHHTGGGNQCSSDIIQVTLMDGAALKEGDTVSINDSGIKLGDNDDERNVVPASVTVPTTPPDTTNPNVNILALVGQPGFIVSFDDSRVKDFDNTRDADRVRMLIHNDADNKAAINDIVFSAAGANEIAPNSITELIGDEAGNPAPAVADVRRIFRIPATHEVRVYRVMLGENEDEEQMTLERRDRITVKNAVYEDGFGNRNRSVTQATVLPPSDPKVTSVRMSQPKYSVGRVQSHMAVQIPDDVAGGDSQVWITANADGAAAGAAGNDWSFVFDKASTWDADNDQDIDVRVNPRDKTVSVRFDDGKVKQDDLVEKMNSNSRFAAMFTATNYTRENKAGIPCPVSVNEDLPLNNLGRQIPVKVDRAVDDTGDIELFYPRPPISVITLDMILSAHATGLVYEADGGFVGFAALKDEGGGEFTGRTGVALEVNFNGYVDMIFEGGTADVFVDVFADTLDRLKIDVDGDDNGSVTSEEEIAARTAYRGTDGGLVPMLASVGSGTDTFVNTGETFADTGVSTPSRVLRFDVNVTDAARLPQERDVVDVAGGTNRVLDDADTTEDESAAPVIDVAIGFIDNPDTGTVVEGDAAFVLAVISGNAPVVEIGETLTRVSTDNELLNDDSQTRIVESNSVQ